MQKLIISLICCLLPALAVADTLKVREGAPDFYVVKKGDTLWDISAKFFEDPWKWPQIWGLNKDAIKNPHWIYPGDVVVFDGQKLTVPGTVIPPSEQTGKDEPPPPIPVEGDEGRTIVDRTGLGIRIYPHVHEEPGTHDAITSIPFGDIKPFLNRAMVIEEGEMDDAPIIVSGFERSMLSTGDIAYVKNLPTDKGLEWQVYRPGKPLVDPVNRRVLGYEAIYLGAARVEQFGDVSTLRIHGAVREIYPGDRLVQAPNEFPENFIPRSPDNDLEARVIKVVDGIDMAGPKGVVVINQGRRDGIQNGHVLALYRKGTKVKGEQFGMDDMQMPNIRYGLLFIFRTFGRVSYGLVMQSTMPVELMDVAQTP
jgi:hypothetical protein